jgi:uncharacterized protein (TIGR01777 family)
MRIVVAAGTGFLGRPLCRSLAADGHEVLVLSRSAPPASASHHWTGAAGVRAAGWTGEPPASGWGHLVDGVDAIVNLAGESIGEKRWTAARKAAIERSRIQSTRALVEAIGSAAAAPRVLLNASAVGYYGSRGDEILRESSPPGEDFLAGVTARWEQEAARASSSHTRVVRLRSGAVLGLGGGALGKMVPPFRLGLGGPFGSGRQYMAWIHLDDWCGAVRWLLTSGDEGAYNLTGPTPVTNAAFSKALGSALNRPAVLPAPAFALRLALGEMAEPLLLASQRVVPERLLAEGFGFRFATVDAALNNLFSG